MISLMLSRVLISWLWPCLSRPLSALRHVMYIRFCGWRHVFSQWAP